MKTIKTLMQESGIKARSTDEQRFVDQHEIEIIKHPVAPESQFKGTIAKKKRIADNDEVSSKTSYDKAYSMKESDDRSEMLVRQLHFISYAAEEIVEFLEEGRDIESWYQNKIAIVFDSMEGLYSFAEGEKQMNYSQASEYGYNESADLSENTYKAGEIVLDNNDKIKVTAQDAKLLNTLLKDLDDKNRKSFEQILMSDKSGFEEIVGFAREAI
jgi:hypothetical protein